MVLGYHWLTPLPRSAQNIEQLFFDVLKNRLETYSICVASCAKLSNEKPPNCPTKIDTEKAGEPAFRMVLTATGMYAYALKDGTLVVPIGCLRP